MLMQKIATFFLLLFDIFSFTNLQAQTTGLMFEPSSGLKSNETTKRLDPDRNNYISDVPTIITNPINISTILNMLFTFCYPKLNKQQN